MDFENTIGFIVEQFVEISFHLCHLFVDVLEVHIKIDYSKNITLLASFA